MQVAELTIRPVGQLAGLGITHNMLYGLLNFKFS